jgi:hypothetical protein
MAYDIVLCCEWFGLNKCILFQDSRFVCFTVNKFYFSRENKCKQIINSSYQQKY